MKYLVSVVTIVSLLNVANAWFGVGHLLVSRIAYDILQETSPETLSRVENLLSVLTATNSTWTKDENKHPMVECATFADDIKGMGGRFQSGWHFVDQPYYNEGKSPDFKFKYAQHNITEAISHIVDWMNKAPGYDQTYIYEQVMSNLIPGQTEENGKSIAMRLLIHYLGDVHQPLHCTALVNSKYPKGDRGGNSFPIHPKDDINELHAVWDSIIYEFPGYPTLPFSDQDWESHGRNATRMVDDHKVSPVRAKQLDPVDWSVESFVISRDFVYQSVSENAVLDQTYVKKARSIAESQIVLAGNRLANLLKSLDLQEYDHADTAFLQ